MKRKLLTMSALALVCCASVACSSNNTNANLNTTANTNVTQESTTSQSNINNNTSNKITEEKAKEIALNHANLSQNDVTFIRSNIDYDDGFTAYDVEFYSNNQEYDYKIDANSGDIIEYDLDVENYAIPQTNNNVNNNVNSNTNLANNNLNNSNNVAITDAKAKEIALKHANLSASQVQYLNAHLDYDDGMQVYDVNFYANNVEHSYEIDAQTGNIVSYDVDSMYD